MNEIIEVGDIVTIIAPIEFPGKDGNPNIELEGRECMVLFTFEDWQNEKACILDVPGVCQSPFRMSDLKLKEKHQIQEAEPEPTQEANSRLLDEDTYQALRRLGILNTSVRAYNRGTSDYSRHIIQPWAIWQEYNLNPWDADIVKRILRTKQGDSRRLDYEKIIHICEERIRQIDTAWE